RLIEDGDPVLMRSPGLGPGPPQLLATPRRKIQRLAIARNPCKQSIFCGLWPDRLTGRTRKRLEAQPNHRNSLSRVRFTTQADRQALKDLQRHQTSRSGSRSRRLLPPWHSKNASRSCGTLSLPNPITKIGKQAG